MQSLRKLTTSLARKSDTSNTTSRVIGPSGAGKSSVSYLCFTVLSTKFNRIVHQYGNGESRACQRFGIVHAKYWNYQIFPLEKRKPDVVLIDAPGFNHKQMSNAEVLKVIADWLKATCVSLLYEGSTYSAAAFYP